MDAYSYLSNADVAATDELYQAYKADPASVDEGWRRFFEGFDLSQKYPAGMLKDGNGNGNGKATEAAATGLSGKETQVLDLINGYRSRAHLRSDINPVRKRRPHKAFLDLGFFGLSDQDLDGSFDAGKALGLGRATLRQIISKLQEIYEGPIGFEYMYMRDQEALAWLRQRIETWRTRPLDKAQKTSILGQLNEGVVFEDFLGKRYMGAKRFSLEGGESTLAALHAMCAKASELGIAGTVLGMAHRGRLNVLANFLRKPYRDIFLEFEADTQQDLSKGSGDVKYHKGFTNQIEFSPGKPIEATLCPNPSHLEAVNPVMEGIARAVTDRDHHGELGKVLPIVIHGDAAIAGQGIVYEVTQMADLKGYGTGGTVHFVINNQVGFTTDLDDARSSTYCTDVAKVIYAPVFHVNGDDPEAVVQASRLAVEFRQTFGQDIFIDMVCYRRQGHNESDEPKFTQPLLYKAIDAHANVSEVYAARLVGEGVIAEGFLKQADAEFRGRLQGFFTEVNKKGLPYPTTKLEKAWSNMRRSTPPDFDQSPQTGIGKELIARIGKALTALPEGFTPLKQIDKVIAERKAIFAGTQSFNWAAAELLAYGSLLAEGRRVRLTGQDVQRGTFTHRHAVLHDAVTNQEYNSLNGVGAHDFDIYNSLLSEYGVLGFEYGYAMANPDALVLWEAQFGDFANGAQIIIDQFISCSETKWQRMTGLVMLLPHGYEGQGPEHSNARPERFLQLAAEQNMFVCNITEPANFFHMLRRQVALPFRKPCVVMSPKSLFRHKEVVSPLEAFTKGSFQEVLPDPSADPKKVKKVLLCTGKIYYELLDARRNSGKTDTAIIRLEQLAPFPQKQLDAALAPYKKAELVWVQEEPENMGYYSYMLRMLRGTPFNVISRKASASPATGYMKVHLAEQKEILEKAVGAPVSKATPIVDSKGVDG